MIKVIFSHFSGAVKKFWDLPDDHHLIIIVPLSFGIILIPLIFKVEKANLYIASFFFLVGITGIFEYRGKVNRLIKNTIYCRRGFNKVVGVIITLLSWGLAILFIINQ